MHLTLPAMSSNTSDVCPVARRIWPYPDPRRKCESNDAIDHGTHTEAEWQVPEV